MSRTNVKLRSCRLAGWTPCWTHTMPPDFIVYDNGYERHLPIDDEDAECTVTALSEIAESAFVLPPPLVDLLDESASLPRIVSAATIEFDYDEDSGVYDIEPAPNSPKGILQVGNWY